eukprot:5409888-Prymnesium_polylepis.1
MATAAFPHFPAPPARDVRPPARARARGARYAPVLARCRVASGSRHTGHSSEVSGDSGSQTRCNNRFRGVQAQT